MKAKILFVGILVSIFLLQGCYTPATFQSAKLVPEKKVEICPTCTINKPFAPDNPNIGFVVTRGVKPKKILYTDMSTSEEVLIYTIWELEENFS